MRTYNRALVILTLSLTVTGCATGYQSIGFTGGHSETWLGSDMVRVEFTGNGYTRSERAADFSLLRVAELGLEAGYPYFILLDQNSQTSTSKTPESYSATTIGPNTYINKQGGWTITKPNTTNVAKFLKAKPENQLLGIYETEFVCKSIKLKYELDEVRC